MQEQIAQIEVLTGRSEHEIAESFEKLLDINTEQDILEVLRNEHLAFLFCENYRDKSTGWGTYFGPMMVWKAEDGRIMESPSIQLLNEEIITYWEQRAKTSLNSLMKARYLGLVWEFSEKVTGKKPEYKIAQEYCKALIMVAKEKNHKFETKIIDKLERALSIATLLNNRMLISEVKQAILDYEFSLNPDDNKAGLWGFSFDFLIFNKKVDLSEDEERIIVENLEHRLDRLKNGDPWICENAAARLARYYRSKGLNQDCSRVIGTLGEKFEEAASKSPSLVAQSLLEHIHKVYSQFERHQDKERIMTTIRSIGKEINKDMKHIEHSSSIDGDEFRKYINLMTDGNLHDVLFRIAIQYIPRHDDVKTQVFELAKEYPLKFLFKTRIIDAHGRVVATIGGLNDDLDGNIVRQMYQNICISQIFLASVFSELIRKFNLNSNDLIEYLFSSPVFFDNQRDILFNGIQKYFDHEYMIASHLIIPQIEATIRNFVELAGGIVLKPSRVGGFQLKTLDDLLRCEEFINTYGEDISFYFRVVLTDQRGWNMRNNICHGFFQPSEFSANAAEQLIHILLVLSLARNSNGQEV